MTREEIKAQVNTIAARRALYVDKLSKCGDDAVAIYQAGIERCDVLIGKLWSLLR